MEALLAVLLYLQLIVSPGEYHESEIYAIEQAHQPQVDTVENDPQLYQAVQVQYAEEVDGIIIIVATDE